MSASPQACLLAAVVLAGCVVGPRYVAPAAPSNSQGAFVAIRAGAAVSAPLPDGWWRLYRDPILDQLVLAALSENRDLKIAAANLAYSEALLSQAGAGRFPATMVAAGGAEQRSAAQALAGRPAAFVYSAGLSASYEVDLFGRITRAIQAARADVQATQATQDAVRVAVAARTAAAYANICGFGEQLVVAKRSIALVRQAYDLTVAQRDAGALSDFDVNREAVLL